MLKLKKNICFGKMKDDKEEKFLIGKGESQEKYVKKKGNFLKRGEENKKEKRGKVNVESEEKCLIREEEIKREEEENLFCDEEIKDFIRKEKEQRMQEKENEQMEKELGEQIVFKVEREAVSRFKEKLEEQATMEDKGRRMLRYEIYVYFED